jgi:hypothetical protein
MLTEHPACSEAGGVGSNPGVEAPWSEPASRSASEPETASLHKLRSANLSNEPKPEIRREVMFTSNGGDLRGHRGQRAGKVWLGRLGDPCCRFRDKRNKTWTETIRSVLVAGESERPIVAEKRGNARGAKGPWQERSGLGKTRS